MFISRADHARPQHPVRHQRVASTTHALYRVGMQLDTNKLFEIANNLSDFGALLGNRNQAADRALWRDMGAAFEGISAAISDLTAAIEAGNRP